MEALCSRGLVTWKEHRPEDCAHRRGRSTFSPRHSFLLIDFIPLSIQLCLHPSSFRVCFRVTPSENRSISPRSPEKERKDREREREREGLCQPDNLTVLRPPDTITYGQIQLQKKAQTTPNLKAPSVWLRPQALLAGSGLQPPAQPACPSLCALFGSLDFSAFSSFSLWSLLFTPRGYYGNSKVLLC